MKLKSLTIAFTSLMIIYGVIIHTAQPSQADSKDRYFCAILNGKPRTFATTGIKTYTLLTWVHEYSNGWTPLKRCVEVSKRFQGFSDNDNLQYINAADNINGQPVLCAVAKKGDRCDEENLLVTLPQGEDAYATAQKLLDVGSLASEGGIDVSGDKKLETVLDRGVYYDLKVIKQRAKPVYENLTPIDSY